MGNGLGTVPDRLMVSLSYNSCEHGELSTSTSVKDYVT